MNLPTARRGRIKWSGVDSPGPDMGRCLTLAALLHLWLVLALGNAPSGSAPEGRGVWGTINVTLRGLPTGQGKQEATVASDAYTGPSGTAEARRWGGTVRPNGGPRPEQTGAPREGVWQATPRPDGPTEAAAPLADPPAPSAPPVVPARATAPSATPAQAVAAEVAPVPVPVPGVSSVREAPAPVDLAPRVSPPLPDLPMPLSATPGAEARWPAALPAPALPPVPIPAVLPAPALAPAPAPAVPAVPSAPPAARSPAPAAPPPPVQAPRPQPAVPAPPAPVPAPPAPVPAPPAPVPAPPAPVPAPPAPVPAPPAPVAAPRVGLDGAAEAASRSARPVAVDAGAANRLTPAAGAPDAGTRVGRDVATPPSLPASAPRLQLDLVRPRGGELSRSSSGGLVRVVPRPPEPEAKGKLAESLEKAQKPDCRTAYSSMGLAAAAPLVRDALSGEGCRW